MSVHSEQKNLSDVNIIENSKDILLRKKQKAVALRYQPEFDSAPKILAGGDCEVANRIVELAKQHDVPIYEQPDVVEALAKLEVGTEVPPEFYQIVAEVLAFVYSIDRKWESRST